MLWQVVVACDTGRLGPDRQAALLGAIRAETGTSLAVVANHNDPSVTGLSQTVEAATPLEALETAMQTHARLMGPQVYGADVVSQVQIDQLPDEVRQRWNRLTR